METNSKKFIKLTEKDIVNICSKLIESKSKKRLDEQVINNYDTTYDYRKHNGVYGYKRKDDLTWHDLNPHSTNPKDIKALDAIKTKVFKESPSTGKTVLKSKVPIANSNISPCQILTEQTPNINSYFDYFGKKYNLDVNKFKPELLKRMNTWLNNLANIYKKHNINDRIACEIAYIKIRPEYINKNIFIVDTLNKTISLFGTNGTLIASDGIISGKNSQINDVLKIANAFKSYEDTAREKGFVFDQNKRIFYDPKDPNKINKDTEIWNEFDKNKSRFLPAGIYKGTSITTSKADVNNNTGGGNVLRMSTLSGKEIGQAIHGYYKEAPRDAAMKLMQSILKNPNDTKQMEQFINLVRKGGMNLNFSYGCINIPQRFIQYIQKYGPNSFIFNISEDQNNYLVQNTQNFIDKMTNSQTCPSPQSLGAQYLNNPETMT